MPRGTRKEAALPAVYQLKVTLAGARPPIWRLQVPDNANLGWLHAVIQVAMGWTNSHLHQFHVGSMQISDPSFELDELEGSPKTHDENKTRIGDVAPRVGSKLVYEYDFGDSWVHHIAVEKILEPDPQSARVARCLAGARACPPEDCGGVWGYQELLQVIRNPKHKEHESMMEWLGGGFDSEAFDCEVINRHLRLLRWPRMTVGQLASALMLRDGVEE
jgi:hypothetical protein